VVKHCGCGFGLALGGGCLHFWLVCVRGMSCRRALFLVTTTPAAMGLTYPDVALPTFHRAGRGPRISRVVPAAHPRGVVTRHGGNATGARSFFRRWKFQAFLVTARLHGAAPDLRITAIPAAPMDAKITIGVDDSLDVRGAIAFRAASQAVRRAADHPVR